MMNQSLIVSYFDDWLISLCDSFFKEISLKKKGIFSGKIISMGFENTDWYLFPICHHILKTKQLIHESRK